MLRVIIFFLLLQIVTFSQWDKTSTTMVPQEIFFVDSLNGLILGDNGNDKSLVGRTNDGGISWDISEVPYMGDNLFVLTEQIVFTFGFSNKLFRSIDNGISWELVFRGDSYDQITDISFINDSEGFLVAGQDIYKTINSGSDWNKIELPDSILSEFRMVHFIDESTGWVSTTDWPNQSFLWTYDGGIEWVKKEVSMPLPFYKPKSFVTPLLGFLKASSNDIYKTSDGGLTWEKLNSSFPTLGFINEINFVSENIGFVGGEYYNEEETFSKPSIYKTTDGGDNWELVFEDGVIFTKIYSMFFLNKNYGWVCSPSGLFKTSTGGVTNVIKSEFDNLKNSYELFQNYPNPFNPSTLISYSIPKDYFVSIKIYDSLGKLVSTLVNSKKNAGNYSVPFNAKALSSGIYFYKITTSEFSETKKMLLLR